MGSKRAGMAHRTVVQLEPRFGSSMIGATLGLLVTAAVAAAALLYRTDRWPSTWPQFEDLPEKAPLIVAAVAGGMALLFLLSAFHFGRRWRTARRIERLSNDPSLAPYLPDPAVDVVRSVAPVIPPLQVDVFRRRQLPKPPKLRRVDDHRNVIGRPPLQIAFLRLFENRPRTRTFVEGAWREFGTVVALRSAASVTPAEFRQARRDRGLTGLFVDSHERLADELARTGRSALRRGRRTIVGVAPSKVRVRDPYGSYPMAAVLCHGRFWKAALDDMLSSVDLVVLDLSGYTDAHAGTHHELQRLVDRFPIERVVLLADSSSNLKFLNARIQLAWSQMAAGSPNASAPARHAVLAITDRIVHQTSTQTSTNHATGSRTTTTTTRVRLVSSRRRTRRIAAMAQLRLAD